MMMSLKQLDDAGEKYRMPPIPRPVSTIITKRRRSNA